MQRWRIFLAAPFADGRLLDELITALHDAGGDVWLHRRVAFDEPFGNEAKRELYQRDVAIMLITHPDQLGDAPPEELRRLQTLPLSNPLRLVLPVLAVAPATHSRWRNFFGDRGTPSQSPQDNVAWIRILLQSPGEASRARDERPAQDLLQLARVLNLAGDHREALVCLQRAEALQSTLFGLWTNLGYTSMLLEQWEEGREASWHAFVVGLERTTSNWCRGVCLTALGRFDEALAAFKRSLSTSDRHSAAWLGKGVALLALNQKEEAREAFERSLEVDPDNPWANEDSHNRESALRYLSAL